MDLCILLRCSVTFMQTMDGFSSLLKTKKLIPQQTNNQKRQEHFETKTYIKSKLKFKQRHLKKNIAGLAIILARNKSPAEMMKLIKNSETMNPCSVSVVYKWHERFRNWRKSTEDGFEGWFALGCENDYEGHHFLTRLAKTSTKHDV